MYVFQVTHFIPDDLLCKLVFFNTLRGTEFAHQGTYGGLGCSQAVRTIPNPVFVRGSSREHGGQSPPYAVISGWKRNSDWAELTQQRWIAGVAAMSMRLTCQCCCGNLGVANHAWVVSQVRQLKKGSKLTGMNGTRVQLKLVGGARRIQVEPDSK
jgi:hypothetical protein